MAQHQDSTVQNIREYVKEAQEIRDGAMDFDASSTEARLERTVKELQARVQEQQAALEKVRRCRPGRYLSTDLYKAQGPVQC